MLSRISYSLIAAEAGLLGWLIASVIIIKYAVSPFKETLLLTMIPAITIGGVISSTERIERSGWRGAIGGGWGALLGGIGGAIAGLLFSEVFGQLSTSNPRFARIIGCLVLGIFIAAGESIRLRSWIRARHGIIGGSISGIIGGALYHTLYVQFGNLIGVQAFIFLLLGGFTAFGIHGAIYYSREVYLKGHPDNVKKCPREINLYSDTNNVIGNGDPGYSTQKAKIHIRTDDPYVDPLHAVIKWNKNTLQYELQPYYVYNPKIQTSPPAGDETYVNGKKISGVYPLHENDLIRFGRRNQFYLRFKKTTS